MSLRMDIWQVVDGKLQEIETSRLDLEQNLEDWIMKDSSILGMDVLLIGQQVITEYGGSDPFAHQHHDVYPGCLQRRR